MLSEKVFKSGYGVTSKSKLAGNEKNDCFVRACSNAFDVSYEQAHEFVKEKFNRKTGKGTKMCNLTMKGLTNETIEFKPEGRLINTKYKHKKVAYTVKTFMQKFKKGTYILLVNKHALVCKGGVIFDNGDMQFTGYRRPVEAAFLIKEELN